MDKHLRLILSRALLLAVLWLAPSTALHAQALGTLTTFGDSYTQGYWKAVPNWVTQLRSQGAVAVRVNYAQGGATAAGTGNGRKTFDGQLDEWERSGRPLARRTVVYFGYNDIHRRLDLGKSSRALAAGVDRLIRGRANRDGRRVLLTLVHDWSRNPGGVPAERARVATWNRQVRGIAAARGLRTIDVYAKVNAVFSAPRRYGITNTTSPSRTDPAHLFFDPGHFGQRGQEIVANTMRYALAR